MTNLNDSGSGSLRDFTPVQVSAVQVGVSYDPVLAHPTGELCDGDVRQVL